MRKHTNIVYKTNCVGIQPHKSQTFMNLKMALFDNGNMEEFLLFINNFQMNIEASGTFDAGAKIQYLYTLLCGDALCQLDMLSAEVGSNTSEH